MVLSTAHLELGLHSLNYYWRNNTKMVRISNKDSVFMFECMKNKEKNLFIDSYS